jgi:hypothetical protein
MMYGGLVRIGVIVILLVIVCWFLGRTGRANRKPRTPRNHRQSSFSSPAPSNRPGPSRQDAVVTRVARKLLWWLRAIVTPLIAEDPVVREVGKAALDTAVVLPGRLFVIGTFLIDCEPQQRQIIESQPEMFRDAVREDIERRLAERRARNDAQPVLAVDLSRARFEARTAARGRLTVHVEHSERHRPSLRYQEFIAESLTEQLSGQLPDPKIDRNDPTELPPKIGRYDATEFPPAGLALHHPPQDTKLAVTPSFVVEAVYADTIIGRVTVGGPLDRAASVGRAAECSVVVPAEVTSVSNTHAVVGVRAGKPYVRDTSSTGITMILADGSSQTVPRDVETTIPPQAQLLLGWRQAVTIRISP